MGARDSLRAGGPVASPQPRWAGVVVLLETAAWLGVVEWAGLFATEVW